jgi:hypothetical protein
VLSNCRNIYKQNTFLKYSFICIIRNLKRKMDNNEQNVRKKCFFFTADKHTDLQDIHTPVVWPIGKDDSRHQYYTADIRTTCFYLKQKQSYTIYVYKNECVSVCTRWIQKPYIQSSWKFGKLLGMPPPGRFLQIFFKTIVGVLGAFN